MRMPTPESLRFGHVLLEEVLQLHREGQRPRRCSQRNRWVAPWQVSGTRTLAASTRDLRCRRGIVEGGQAGCSVKAGKGRGSCGDAGISSFTSRALRFRLST